jgi:hypothetical protein
MSFVFERFATLVRRGTEHTRNQKGQSLLELALVLPLLMLIAFGAIEFGRAYYQYNTLTKALRDGARYMSYHIYSSAEETNCYNMVVYGNTAGSGSPVLPGLTTSLIDMVSSGGTTPYSALNPPRFITIRVTGYPFNRLIPLIPINATFRPEVTMRYVGPGSKL